MKSFKTLILVFMIGGSFTTYHKIHTSQETLRSRFFKRVAGLFGNKERGNLKVIIKNDIPDFELVHQEYTNIFHNVHVLIDEQELAPGEQKEIMLHDNACNITLVAPISSFEQFLKPEGLFKFLMKYATVHLSFKYTIEKPEELVEISDVLFTKYQLWEENMPTIEKVSINPFALKVHIVVSDTEIDVSLTNP